jgi:hypothetical protein
VAINLDVESSCDSPADLADAQMLSARKPHVAEAMDKYHWLQVIAPQKVVDGNIPPEEIEQVTDSGGFRNAINSGFSFDLPGPRHGAGSKPECYSE